MKRNIRQRLIAAVMVLFIFAVVIITLGLNNLKNIKGNFNANDLSTWRTVFYDDFSGPSLDESKWSTCYEWYSKKYMGCSNNGNNELEWYLSQQVAIRNGNLVLTAEKQQITGWDGKKEKSYEYISGMVSTGRRELADEPKWDATFGYYEARIKVPSGKGIWPAFWLLPTDKVWPPEIDIMEILGDKPNQVLMTYHFGETDSPQKEDTVYTAEDFTKGWHTYSVKWEPGKIEWFIDGVLRKTSVGSNIPSEPMQVILNLAVGGNLPGSPDDNTVFPSEMLVDYVRVKQPSE